MKYHSFIFLAFVIGGCQQEPTPGPIPLNELYFPPIQSEHWETTSSSLEEEKVQNLEKLLA